MEIDPRDYQINLRGEASLQSSQADEQKAAADVEAARATWVQQEQDRRRNEELVKQGATTVQTLEHSRAAADTAQANLNAQEKDLASVGAKTAVAQVAVDAGVCNCPIRRSTPPKPGTSRRNRSKWALTSMSASPCWCS